MEEEFRALLLADSGVSDHVAGRIDFGERPQGDALPAIVLNVISGAEGIHMNGKGPFDGRVQVDCYAMNYRAAMLTARAVRDVLNAHVGGGFLFIRQESLVNSREGAPNDAVRMWRAGMDFKLSWRIE